MGPIRPIGPMGPHNEQPKYPSPAAESQRDSRARLGKVGYFRRLNYARALGWQKGLCRVLSLVKQPLWAWPLDKRAGAAETGTLPSTELCRALIVLGWMHPWR